MKKKECVTTSGKMDGLGNHMVYRYHDDVTGETFQIGTMGRTADELIDARNKFIKDIRANYDVVEDVNSRFWATRDALRGIDRPGTAKLLRTKGVNCGTSDDTEKYALDVNREYLLLANLSCKRGFPMIRGFYGKSVGNCFDKMIEYINNTNSNPLFGKVCNTIELVVVIDEQT